jgi:hypothetical protein
MTKIAVTGGSGKGRRVLGYSPALTWRGLI